MAGQWKGNLHLPRFLRSADVYSIEPVPTDQRSGRARDLLPIWTVANCQLGALATGVIATLIGLSLPWAIFSIIIGNLVGCIFMAYHSAQGPTLGLPQMIQSRAQFGVFGNLLPLIIVFLIYLGFYITSTVLIGQALAALLNIALTPAIWLGSVLSIIMVFFGYHFIHYFSRYLAFLNVAVFIVITVALIDKPIAVTGSGNWSLIVLMIAIAAGWQLTWAPYVSDYSRYLPRETSTAKTFIFTYAGAAGGGIWLMILGAMGGAAAGDQIVSNTAGYIGGLFPAIPWLAYLVIAATGILIQSLSLYSGFMAIITGLFPSARLPNARTARTVAAVVIGLSATVPGVVISQNFLTSFFDFLLFILYFAIPWTAINIADFYLVRKGKYHLPSMFDPRGRYGMVRWRAILTYLIALAAEIPFMNTTFYQGPISEMLGGADFAWVVGLLLSFTLYMLWAAPHARQRDRSAANATPGANDIETRMEGRSE